MKGSPVQVRASALVREVWLPGDSPDPLPASRSRTRLSSSISLLRRTWKSSSLRRASTRLSRSSRFMLLRIAEGEARQEMARPGCVVRADLPRQRDPSNQVLHGNPHDAGGSAAPRSEIGACPQDRGEGVGRESCLLPAALAIATNPRARAHRPIPREKSKSPPRYCLANLVTPSRWDGGLRGPTAAQRSTSKARSRRGPKR